MVVTDRLRTEFDRQARRGMKRVDATSEPSGCLEQFYPPASGAGKPPGGIEAGNAAADDRNVRFHLPPSVQPSGCSNFASTGRLGKAPDGSSYARMLTARAATSAIVSREIIASAIIRSLARCESGMVSVGENAVALVKARKT